MYGDRRYTSPSSRQSYGRQDLRRNPIQTSSSSSQRKHSSQSRGRPNSGQFLKPVEPVRKEPVHSSKERATAKKEAEKKANYSYSEEVYVEADSIGYDDSNTEDITANKSTEYAEGSFTTQETFPAEDTSTVMAQQPEIQTVQGGQLEEQAPQLMQQDEQLPQISQLNEQVAQSSQLVQEDVNLQQQEDPIVQPSSTFHEAKSSSNQLNPSVNDNTSNYMSGMSAGSNYASGTVSTANYGSEMASGSSYTSGTVSIENYGSETVTAANYPQQAAKVNSYDGRRMVDVDSLIKPNERKFSGRGRLFIANLQGNITEQDVNDLFGKYGETSEVYVNKDKGFGFIRMDYKINAEIAKNALDGVSFKGRFIKVRFAAHQSAIEIHGIDRFSSNESLEQAFSQFGVVENARIVCDERGKSKGYAIIEFAYKKSAQVALQKINAGLFVLGRLPKPVTAKPLTQTDEDGIHEKDLERIPGIMKDREYSARFILPDTPEYDWAKKWKDLDVAGKAQREALDKQLEEEKDKLEIEIETSVHDSEADYIRQELLQRQAALEDEIRRYDDMLNASRNRQAANAITQSLQRAKRNEEARRQDEFIKKQQQELLRRHGGEDMMRAMQGQGMPRMPGPRGPIPGMMGPRGMLGSGDMRPMYDQGRGGIRPGMRRPGPKDSPYTYKRPRK